jgi:hypothetical protein
LCARPPSAGGPSPVHRGKSLCCCQYQRREPADYDKALCLVPKDAVSFVQATQLGESTKSLKQVLAADSLDEAERQDGGKEEEDLEDRIVAEMKRRGRLPNVSYFAFTATPNPDFAEDFLGWLFERYRRAKGQAPADQAG